MNILTLILTGFALAMDATAISIAKGMSLSKKYLYHNAFLIALFFSFFQGFMPILGYFIGSYFTDIITNIDHWITFFLLCCIGFNMIKESLGKSQDENNDTLNIPFKTIVFLAVATSVDAFVIGVSFAFLKINIMVASSIIAGITFILSYIGVLVGKQLGYICEKYAERLGGSILIFLGVKTLIEHLFLS